MKAEAQRIAIAEFCGWKRGVANVGKHHEKVVGFWYGDRFHVCECPGEYPFPDYLNCLNAMAVVEKRLRTTTGHESDAVVGDRMHEYVELLGYCIDASASQRAEALLRTIGKWVEE